MKCFLRKSCLAVIGLVVMVPSLWAATAQEEYQAGLSYYQQGQYDKAVQSMQSAVKENPGFWQAYQVLGQSYYQLHQNENALEAYNQSLKLHSDNPVLQKFVNTLQKNDNKVKFSSTEVASPAKASVPSGQASLNSSPNRTNHFEINLSVAGVYSRDANNPAVLGVDLSGYYFIEPNFGVGCAIAYNPLVSDVSGGSKINDNTVPGGSVTQSIEGSYSLAYLEFLGSAKYLLGSGGFIPYLTAGFGLSILNLSGTSYIRYDPEDLPKYPSSQIPIPGLSAINPMVQPGLGCEILLTPGLDIFGELKSSFIFSNVGTGQLSNYQSFLVGLNVGL